MASVDVTDVQIDFQSGRMSCNLPKGILEVIIMANCDWGQAKVIADRAFKTNTIRSWTQQFKPHHTTM